MRRQVSELKKTIEETKNMTVQKLIYLGKILDEDKTLGEIGVKESRPVSFPVCEKAQSNETQRPVFELPSVL